jgi:uncharacterized protein YceH (UPF0502 family)
VKTVPSEGTRRLLKLFGVAVTDLEDAVQRAASKEELARIDAELSARLKEVNELIAQLRARGK